jgi:PAS domain S-box-containing protein
MVVTSDSREATRERLRANEEQFRLLVEGVEDYAIFMLDPTGRVVTWNTGAQRIKGYRADEIIGQHFSRFYPEQDVRAGKTEFELKIAARDGRFEDEGWRLRKDGSRFWANVVITALRDSSGRLLGFAKVTRDLTDRRRLEEERLGRAKAEEALRLRDEFLSIASHELGTPLTALQLQLQGILYKIGTTDGEVGKQLQRASRSADRLAGLVATLLDVSRIATGRFELHLERFDLSQLAREVVEGLQDAALAAECELRLNTDHPLVGMWDRLRVEQMLSNLLSNAFKYAAGSPVSLSVLLQGDDAVVEVRDGGPGISEQNLHRIFDRFERAHPSRQYGGMGLGLYVTRQIAEAHGGAVVARNLPEGGACFTVRLPFTPIVKQQPAAPA